MKKFYFLLHASEIITKLSERVKKGKSERGLRKKLLMRQAKVYEGLFHLQRVKKKLHSRSQ